MEDYHQVIFLDVDGVLNSTRSQIAFGGFPNVGKPHAWYKMDDIAVRMVRGLSQTAKAPIVLSSAWRVGDNYLKVAEYFNLNIIDKTGQEQGVRGNQIKAWLERNPHVKNYVILDDSNDIIKEQEPYFIQINSDDGLSFSNIKSAGQILGIETKDIRRNNRE